MDSETAFLSGLIELQYGQDVQTELKQIARNVAWASGWPSDKKAFWNAEAFMWQNKINRKIRTFIKEELSFLDGENCDLGCGAYSYLSSVGFDLSEKMLQLNENCSEKVVGDLEQALSFSNSSFNSVTAVFVLNYVQNFQQLLSEIKRILVNNGTLVIVLSSRELNQWQRQKEVNCFSSQEWVNLINDAGFSVEFYEKEKLWFFKCREKTY